MKYKKLLKLVLCLFVIFLFNNKVFADNEITVEEDNDSTYIPTNIINGGFDECPWIAFSFNSVTYTKSQLDGFNGNNFVDGSAVNLIYNGTNEGWNTTTNKIYNDGKLFDWTKRTNGVLAKHAINATYNGSLQNTSTYSFIEMNGHEAAVFYQDLNTIGGDVIRWTLNHGIRPTPEAPSIQNISVEIGAPKMSDGKIVTAHGTGDNLYTEIESTSSAKYTKNGVVNGTLNSGYANSSELVNLSLSKSSQYAKWYDARGVYIIPKKQNVTRFAFISDVNNADGNLLDEITFSTLIGNLNAVFNEDKTVTVSGYWGETDPTKKLIIKLGNTDYELDMSSVSGNFKFNISEELIGVETYIEVYHEDYEAAKRIVKIVAGDVTRKVSSEKEKITIKSNDETIINSLDDISKNKVKHGEGVEIWLEINNITETVSEESKELINGILEGNILGGVYDISLYKKLESDEEKIKLEETKEPLEFIFTIPEELINNEKNITRTYQLIRIHNGEASFIDSKYNSKTNTLTFSSDKFSEFAIVYTDKTIENENIINSSIENKKVKNPNTGDNIINYIIIMLSSMLINLNLKKYIKKYN